MALRVGMNCPHCGQRAQIRTSTQITATMRELYFLCNAVPCGHSWVAILEATRTISPSGIPNPSVDLPIMRRQEVERVHDVIKESKQRSIFDDERY